MAPISVRTLCINQSRLLSQRNTVPLAFNTYGDPAKDRASPPLVILHGLFGQKTNWNSVGKALQRKLGGIIYCVDMRNHGSSPKVATMTYEDMAADVAEFIRSRKHESGCDKMHLLGHSMGGKAAMRLAVDESSTELLDKLIIEDVSPKGYSPNNAPFRQYIQAMYAMDLTKPRKEILDGLEPAIPNLAIRQFILTNLQRKDDGTFEWKCNIEAIEQHVDDILGFHIPENTYHGPTLFLHGANSEYVPQSHHSHIRSIFPNSQFVAVPGAGHWVHADSPGPFIDAVVNYLK